ncbi:MAG: tRNA (adenosine(37)-N6)-threonylcarbamoyltransferase complex ATPase subunit type 1 TsaE [Burkholderiaceae bacterium]|nr:tRNA (adenosine(37)-N6)-threonylcarbamoyltransferase complex ATPase subunit type 1 TsaE [Burkholderiaceae bacterium]
MILETRILHWPDEAACEAGARALAACPATRQACIELEGTLGAGKTTFARHLLRALGVTGRIKSPSYAIVEPYELPAGEAGAGPAPLPLLHFDFYRFADPREWEEAGFRDLFAAPGLKLVEWPQRAQGLLPEPDLRLHLEPLPDESRRLVAEACSPAGQALLAALAAGAAAAAAEARA